MTAGDCTQRIAVRGADLEDVHAGPPRGGCQGRQDGVDAGVNGYDVQRQLRVHREPVHGAAAVPEHQRLHARDAVDDAPVAQVMETQSLQARYQVVLTWYPIC